MSGLRIGVVGAFGRMGREVADCVSQADDLRLVALVGRPGHPDIGKRGPWEHAPTYTDSLSDAAEAADVLVDFSLPTAFAAVAAAVRDACCPIVSGTTGLSPEQLTALDEVATVAPCLHSPNMSVGIQVMLELVSRAAQALGPAYDIEVVESHHRHKRDAPSGTAKRLVEVLAAAARPPLDPATIPTHSLRGGDIVGDHTAHFMGPGDRIAITHRATSRRTFAMGALRAARWLVGQAPGRYTMADVLRRD